MTILGLTAVGIERVVPLAVALVLPRVLGIDDYGRYVFLLSYLGLFQLLPDQGLETALVAWLGRARGGDAALAGRAALLRVGVSLLGAGIGLGVLALVRADGALTAAGVVLGVGFAVLAGNPYRTLLRARLGMQRYLVLVGAQAGVTLALLAAAWWSPQVLTVALALCLGNVAGFVVGRVLVGPEVRWAADGTVMRRLLREGWPLVGAALAVVAGQQVVQMVTLHGLGTAAVGALGGAQKLCEAVGLLPQAVMLTLLPRLAALEEAQAVRVARGVMLRLGMVLLPVVVGLGTCGDVIVHAFFGPRYAASIAPLAVLAPATLVTASGVVLTALLVRLGRQRVLLTVNVGTALLMAGAALGLVPGHGVVGAALAMSGPLLVGQGLLLAIPQTRQVAWPIFASMLGPLVVAVLLIVGWH